MNKVPFLRGNLQNQNAPYGGSHESLNSCFIITFMISVWSRQSPISKGHGSQGHTANHDISAS